MPRKLKDKTESVLEKGTHIVCPKCKKDWVKRTVGDTLPARCPRCQAQPLPWGPADKQWTVYEV